MLGAIVGDVAGSNFEGVLGEHVTRGPDCQALFPPGSHFTDDTVMTCAIACAMMQHVSLGGNHDLQSSCIAFMRAWGHAHPGVGYGRRFKAWLTAPSPEPYGSYGNGSAMRVSPVAWLAHSLEETERLAAMTAEVTHNHPEGIKGAKVVAGAIYLALIKASKEEIRDYVGRYYDLAHTLESLAADTGFHSSCQKTVPQAVMCFLETGSLVESVRAAIALHGDTDTRAAIAGSIAEGYYGVPLDVGKQCRMLLTDDILQVLEDFSRFRRLYAS